MRNTKKSNTETQTQASVTQTTDNWVRNFTLK